MGPLSRPLPTQPIAKSLQTAQSWTDRRGKAVATEQFWRWVCNLLSGKLTRKPIGKWEKYRKTIGSLSEIGGERIFSVKAVILWDLW